MRLRCTCGRNLADVTATDHNYDWVLPINHYVPRAWRRDDVYLMVTARSNVDQREHHVRSGTVTLERTYSWQCRCGQNPKRTAEKIALAWDALTTVTTPSPGHARKVVVAVLDVHL